MNPDLITTDAPPPSNDGVDLDKFVREEKEDAVLATSVFYGRNDISELARRLQMMVVGGEDKYTLSQAVTLAQAAFAHGLSPFNGEIWLLVKNGKSIGLMIGIKGLRKHAHRQVRRARTNYHIQTVAVTDPKELEAIAPQKIYTEKVLVYKALLTVEAKVGFWIVNITKLTHAGISSAEATAMVGDRPVTVGYGIYDPQMEKYTWRFGRQSPAQIAQKRAEADVLKKEFDVLLAMEYSEEIDRMFGADVALMDTDFNHDGPPEFEIPALPEKKEPKVPRSQEQVLVELGFDDKKE